MSKGYKCVINAVIYAVALNLILPLIAVRFATDVEKKPPGCPSKLPFKSQVMHMLYHHSKVPVSSSVIVALIVALSITLGYNFKILN